MKIALIAAMAQHRVIGWKNQMPWHLPADLRHFKQLTLHKPIVMGRKTYESLGKALPQRRNLVLSSQDLPLKDAEVYHTLEAALEVLRLEPEVMIIGGQTLFDKTLSRADVLYLTQIDAEFSGDTFFPAFNPGEWQLTAEEAHSADAANPYPYRFLTYCRAS